MPLFGKVMFHAPDRKVAAANSVEGAFVIPHTKEVFTSKEEYEDRLKLYNRKLWTCQCTGHINMTHEEAMESERKSREMLARSFSEVYQHPVLDTAHHSLDVLDKIVNKAYTLIRSQLFVGEKVNFEAMPGRKFDAKIMKVHHEEAAKAETGNGSPSSDKENSSTSKQALITDMFKTVTSPEKSEKSSESPVENSPDLAKEPSNLKYDIILVTENKFIRGVPAKTLTSANHRPSRHLIRLFIRANAIRYDYKKLKAWIVDRKMVEEYGLTSKLSHEEESKLLKASLAASNSVFGYTHRSPITNGVSSHNGDSSPDNNKGTTTTPFVDLEKLTNNVSVDHTEKPVKLAPIFSPAVKSRKIKTENELLLLATNVNSIDYESIATTSTLLEKEKSKGTKAAPQRKRKAKDSSGTESSPKKRQKKKSVQRVAGGGKISDDDDTPLSKLSDSSPASSGKPPGSSRKSTSPKKKKQATLLELTRKKGGMMLMKSTKAHALGSSPASPAKKTPRAPRQPPIVYQLLRLKKEKKFQAHKYKMLVNDAARMLNEKQRKNLPDLVKQDVLTKWAVIERKRKWDSMTPEERKQLRAEERMKKNKKFEDMDIVATGKTKPLPNYEPAAIPGGLPNTAFGNIAMVTEFIHSYRSLLSPRESKVIAQGSLTEALCAGKRGYETVSRVMILMLHMLLRDDIAQDYKELDFNIDKVPITADVCSELTRICLRQLDDDLEDDIQDRSDDQIDEDSAKAVASGIKEEVFSRLLDNEMYEMDANDQLEVLCALVYRLVNTYTAQQFRDETRERATEAWKKLNKIRTEDNLQKKEKKMKKKQEKLELNSGQSTTSQKKDEQPEEEKETAKEGADLISRVKRRRIDAAEKRQEEEQKRLQWEEERQRLYDEQMKEAEHDKAVRQYHDSELLAARSYRLDSLGTDRYHNRYWLFSDCTPGLFVEKGWVQDYITYNTQSEPEMNLTPEKNSAQVSEDELPLSMLGSANSAGGRVSSKETTVPHIGQNLWFVIDSQEKLDQLLASLCVKGIRESTLKKAMEKKYNHIVRSISKYQAALPKLPEAEPDDATSPPVTRKATAVKDPEEDTKKALRKRLQNIIQDISRGGLAEIQDEYDVFVARVESAEQVGEFSALMLDVFNAIDMRFFREYMSGFTPKKNQKRDDLLPFEEQEKLQNPKKIVKAEKRRERWVQAVEGASQFSRLSFLLTILHSSVMWEMYKYSRTMPKRATRQVKNYAEMVQDSPEEEEEEGEQEEEEDAGAIRRSARLGTRGRYVEGTRTRRGLRNKREDPVEESEEEEDSSEAEDDDSQEESQEEDEDQQDDDSEEEESQEEDEEAEDLERCIAVINRILEYKCSKLFRYPVEEEDVPDYYEVIESPVCLLDIKDRAEKASSGNEHNTSGGTSRTRSANRPQAAPPTYSPDQLLEDVRLVMDNAEMYNGQESFVWRQALKLKAAFVRCFQENFRHSIRLTKRLNRLFGAADED